MEQPMTPHPPCGGALPIHPLPAGKAADGSVGFRPLANLDRLLDQLDADERC